VAISQRAADFIHMDECILIYGYSRLVEVFLEAAGAKRRFQVGFVLFGINLCMSLLLVPATKTL
jgi:translation initiation factor 2B subunit (eIF-2B alpha/beta/delta family)